MAMDETNYGGGFGNALYDILLRKREEARQAMLDEVNRKNVESEIAARADQAETNKLYRQSQAETMKSQAADRLVKKYHQGQPVSPSGQEQFKSLGVDDLLNAPAGPPEPADNFGVPKSLAQPGDYDLPTYKGSPEEQESDEDLKKVEAYINSPQGQQLSPEDRAAMYYNAVRSLKGTMPAGFFKGKGATDKEEIALIVPPNKQFPTTHYIFQGKETMTIPAGTKTQRGFSNPTAGANGENVGSWTAIDVPDPQDPTKNVAAQQNTKTGEIRRAKLPPDLAPQPTQVTPPSQKLPNGDVQLFPPETQAAPPARVFSRGTAPKPAPSDKGISSQEITAIRNAFEQTRKNLKSGASTGQARQVMYTPLHVAQMGVIGHLKDTWMRDDVISAVQAAEAVDYNNAKYPFGTIQNFIDNEVDPAGNPLNDAQKADLYRVLSYVLGNF